MTHAETVNFTYESVENFARLLITIQFEKTKPSRDITIYHQRFDKESDEIFGKFLEELFPNGGTIDIPQIDMLVEYVYRFLQKDDKARSLYADYDKSRLYSWVYFKPDNIVRSADIGQHMLVIQDICKDFFKDFEQKDLSKEYMQKFLRENFEIKSDYTTMNNIINDVDWIIREINMYRRNSFKEMTE